MPGLLLETDPQAAGWVPERREYDFVVSHQKLEFDIDFATQTLRGFTEITILPQTQAIEYINIDAKQCEILGNVTINGIKVKFTYDDRIHALDVPDYLARGAEQHEQHRDRIEPLATKRGALELRLPRQMRLEEVDPYSDSAAAPVAQRALGVSAARQNSVVLDQMPASSVKNAAEQSSRYQPLVVRIEFAVTKFRDGLHFSGLMDGATQYPHIYTKHSIDPGLASYIFPCVDDATMRCTWEISITCSRTLGHALRKQPSKDAQYRKPPLTGHTNGTIRVEEDDFELNDEEKLLEMTVVCSGEQIQELDHPDDSSRKIVTFMCSNVVAPQHIGFAIGPFEQIDLTEFREEEDGDKIGQGQSLPVFAYCLPGRSAEVKHVCLPMVHAVDWFMLNFGSYPFSDFSFVFIDGQVQDVEHTASLAICSDRLLYPQTIIDPEMETTRALVHAIASQWIGVSIVANQKVDRWLSIGLSHFMTDRFMQSLCGNNDYMFRQKTLSDKLVSLDVDRPSLYSLGEILHLGQYEMDFMRLKAPLVLFILDKRLHKATSAVGSLVRVLSKLITQANIGSAVDSVLSTEGFRRLVEKVAKWRQTEPFWNQWVLGAGCPKFAISYRFNKKKISVELTISQKQDGLPQSQRLDKESFSRDVKEEINGVYAGELQQCFTGSMTVRIHEADGTPYEHVLEITKQSETFSIPYNTKYKRLKRSNRKKERLNTTAGEKDGELNEDTMYFMLGDILSSEEEMRDWAMTDWDESEIRKMEAESFEWYRVDADFEWLCEKMDHMPGYMYIAQLQQDRDIVAHQESLRYLRKHGYHPLVSTFLTRTVMDHRYFHGIRTMAVDALVNQSVAASNYMGMRQLEKACSEMFCYPETMMPRPNDFSDRRTYNIELAMPHTMSKVRDPRGRCPKPARHFILDQLKFNDNSNNEYSDNFKIASLMTALTTSLIDTDGEENILEGDRDQEHDPEPREFLALALEEFERYRRNDEYSSSYHNTLTVTVLTSRKRLMKAGVIPVDKREFLKYLIDGNLDQVRITAFKALVELGFLLNDLMLKFMLCVLASDPSPYVRTHLFEILVLGLAQVALDVEMPKARKDKPAVDGDVLQIDDGGLQIEENFEFNTEEMQKWVDRTTTIEGALVALKNDLQDNEVLKEALWEAVKSDMTTLVDQVNLLDVCALLYDAVDEMVMTIKYPRYWKVRRLGKGKLQFTQSGRYRTQPRKQKERLVPLAAPVILSTVATVSTITAVRPTPTISLSFSTSKSAPAPRQPLPSAPVSKPVAAPAPKQPLKLVLTAKPSAGTTSVMPKQAVAAPKPAPIPEPTIVAKPIIKLERGPQPLQSLGTMKPPKRPLEPNSEDRTRPSKMLKLSVTGPKLDAILRRTPQPTRLIAQASSKKSKTASPAPRSTIKLEQSPAPRISVSPAPAKQTSVQKTVSSSAAAAKQSTITAIPPSSSSSSAINGAAKPRQKLPDSAGSGARQRLPDSAPMSRPSSISIPPASPVATASSASPTAAEPRKSLKIKLKLGAGTKKFDFEKQILAETSQPPPPPPDST